jgi:hypothetical protein
MTKVLVEVWVEPYTIQYLHSALDDKTPGPYERECPSCHSSPFVAA